MNAKHILLGISAGALVSIIAYNTCKADESVPGTGITGDNDTLTIEYSENYGEFGTRKYVFQQFGKECDMRRLEIQECNNARRNDGVVYDCDVLLYFDYGCDGVVDELYNIINGRDLSYQLEEVRRAAQELGQPDLFNESYVESQQEMEAKAGISLEDEVRKWKGQTPNK